ncbi:MAG: glycosyltransferase family 4 protein [Actinomycetota bacterium]|nr:glycosyltransferase family 4 protein [Actinomycetota bacterium]
MLDIDAAAPVVAIVAQITPWKGQEIAIRAFDGVRKSFPGAKLLIVGKAKFKGQETRFDNVAYEQSLRQLVIDRGLQHAVLFTGEQHDVRPVMNLADVVLMPSWEEPFGRAAVEGMAAGKCVISTNVGGPPEFIVDRETGRLLDPTDVRAWSKAMIELLHDRDERWRIGGAARASVERTFFGASTRTLITPVFEHALGIQAPIEMTA